MIAGIAVGIGCISIIFITIILSVCIGVFAMKSVRRLPRTVVVGDETTSPHCTPMNTNQQQTRVHNAHQPAITTADAKPPTTAQRNYPTQLYNPIQYLQQNPHYLPLQQEYNDIPTETIINCTEAAQEAEENGTANEDDPPPPYVSDEQQPLMV